MFESDSNKGAALTEKDPACSVDEVTLESSANFQPNRILYISPFTGSTKGIKIYDETNELRAQYPGEITSDFKKNAKSIAEAQDPASSLYTIKRENWQMSSFSIRDGGSTDGPTLGHWKAPHFSTGTTELSFPADSKHSSHNFTMHPRKWYRSSEVFVVNSATYIWQAATKVTERRWSLFKIVKGQRIEIARFEMGWGWGSGGVLVVNEDEVDSLLASWTCCIIMRKRFQRQCTYAAGGGAVGGTG